MTFMEDFGKRLRKKIEEIGINQRKVSKLTDVDYPLLNKICNNNQSATLETLNKLHTLPGLEDLIKEEKRDRAKAEYGPEINAEVTVESIRMGELTPGTLAMLRESFTEFEKLHPARMEALRNVRRLAEEGPEGNE